MTLPTRVELRLWIADQQGTVAPRDIFRAFDVDDGERPALRDLVREMADEGTLAGHGVREIPRQNRRPRAPARLGETAMVEVTGTDTDGEAVARPVAWPADAGGPPPQILMAPERRGTPALAPGSRVLARLRPAAHGRYEGRTISRADNTPGRVIGLFRTRSGALGGGGRIVPVDRRSKSEWRVPPGEEAGATDGQIVRGEPLPHAGLGLKPCRVVAVLGTQGDARSVSMIVIANNDIPDVFPHEAIAEAEAATAAGLDDREDLRNIPLITIDGADARDFDDAVYAEPDGAGFRLIVAIADVAHYVRPGSALDREALLRGNSCYFPDRVVPMLPEALSNGWCSLKPDEDRGCLFAEMWIAADGTKTRHRFGRGLMRSAARLTYEQVQAAREETLLPIAPGAGSIPALYAAYAALARARAARGTLELDLPERVVKLSPAGEVAAIGTRPRLDSHKLIEEFMILANVCAAEELERLRLPCMYRVHAPPAAAKLESLREFLREFDVNLPPGDRIHPRDLDRVLKIVEGTDAAPLVNETVLRSQAQAAYSPDNIGHFGLALTQYAHFTSPIRRYADLLVHRALIAGLGLGPDGLPAGVGQTFEEIGETITRTERRAQQAERDAIDRYLAAYMAGQVGGTFEGRVSGVQRFGLFVTLDGSGASGLLPASGLPDDYWHYDEPSATFSGRRTGLSFRSTDRVSVRLIEANALTGGIVFALDRAHDRAHAPDNEAPRAAPGKRTKGPAAKGRAKPGGKPRAKKPRR